jgi:GAF domain-containing protein
MRILPTQRPIMAILMDVVLIHLGLGLAGTPDPALGFPFSYIVISSLLLLEPRWALATITVAGVGIAAIARDWMPLDPATTTEGQTFIIGFAGSLYFMLATMGLMSVMVRLMNRSAQRQTEQNRLQRGLAQASASLLRSSDGAPLESALGALREATDADVICLEMNVQDPDLGLCTSPVAAVLAPGTLRAPERRGSQIPWSERPGRDQLEAGLSLVTQASGHIDGDPFRPMAAGSSLELTFPVFVDGEWWGILGFSDAFPRKPWMAKEGQILQTAAEMVGAFIERTEARAVLDDTMANLDDQVRYHNALSACASLLQSSNDDSALDLALAAILQATDADYAYIDENYMDQQNGPSSRIVHDAEKPGSRAPVATRELWDGPHSDRPTSYTALREGRPVQIRLSELEGAERAAYEEEGTKSELLIPIYLDEEWQGSVAFADYVVERRWDSSEIAALRTAARMIGAFWERRATQRSLESVIERQDRRLRYQRMITNVMTSLTAPRGEDAIEEALGHVMSATEADRVHVEWPRDPAQQGMAGQVISEVVRPGHEHLVDTLTVDSDPNGGGGATGPAAAQQALSGGRPFTNAFTGELSVPIMGRDTWIGTLVLGSLESPRTWHPEEIAAVQEVATWVSGFWAGSPHATGTRPRLSTAPTGQSA